MDNISNTVNKLNDEVIKSQGGHGAVIVTDTNAVSENNYTGFLILADAIISSITYRIPSLVSGDITTETLVTGLYIPIPGGISTLTLASGSIILYKIVE